MPIKKKPSEIFDPSLKKTFEECCERGKKPKGVVARSVGKDEMYTEWYECSNCKDRNIFSGASFCSNCGKKITSFQ